MYEYKATTADGKVLQGSREEESEAAVIRWLQTSGYIPIYARASDSHQTSFHKLKSAFVTGSRLKDAQLLSFTEQIATLIRASVPLDQALRILRETADSPELKALVSRLLSDVESGMEFSAALQAQNVFDSFYINMIRASEASGNLDGGLEQLYRYLENVKATRDKVMSSLLYPLILVIVSGISVLVILTFVVPKISELFNGTNQVLPAPTQFVISVSQLVSSYWWFIPVAIIAVFIYSRIVSRNAKNRVFWEKVWLRLPLFRDFIIKSETAKFARGLSTLSANGVNLQAALPIATATVGNETFSREINKALVTFKEGKSLHAVLKDIVFFPTLALQLIKVGEETGELPAMLSRVAAIYEKETAQVLQRLLTLLEPALIVALGITIGGIIVSILMGIISINDLPF